MAAGGIIIGGGIAGLTTAIALQRHGIPVRIFESAPVILPVGAGIWMAPNAMQVFHRLGIAEKINAGGVPLDRIAVVDRQMKPILQTDQERIRKLFGYTTTAIKRSELQSILLNELDKNSVVLGKTCTAIHEESGKATVVFSDGNSEQGDYVIAADGINSIVRSKLFPAVSFRSTGHVCWRGMAEVQLKPGYKKAIMEYWADGYRFGFSEVHDGVVDWFAVQKDSDSMPAKGEALKQILLDTFSNFAYPLQSILQATDEERIIKNRLIDFEPIKQWSKGRVCLIGDAAHASTPYMGQGGCQAIEDAYVIAQCLHRHQQAETAFAEFQKIRMQKAAGVVNMSRKMGAVGFMSSMFADLRNAAIRATPQFITQQQFQKVYRLNF